MGGITRTLFGGSKDKSSNKAYGTLLGLMQPGVERGGTAMGVLGSILGIGDPAQGNTAIKNYLDSTGYNFMLDEGTKDITNNAAAKGILRSGKTGKDFINYGQDLKSTKVGELMQNLTNLGQYGLGAANTIAGAGQQSKGSSQGGIFNSLFPGGLSDPRVKNFIKKLGTYPDGLEVWVFEYKRYPGVSYVGVNAEQVQKLRPFAMGPMKDGYLTVRYNELPRLDGMPQWGRYEETVK